MCRTVIKMPGTREHKTIQMRIRCRWPPRTRRSQTSPWWWRISSFTLLHHHHVVSKQEREITFIVEGLWGGKGKVFESFWIFYSEQLIRIVQCLFNEQDEVFKGSDCTTLILTLIELWVLSDLERWRLTALDKLETLAFPELLLFCSMASVYRLKGLGNVFIAYIVLWTDNDIIANTCSKHAFWHNFTIEGLI